MKKSEVIDRLEDVVVLLKGDSSCNDLISAVRYAIAVIQGGMADESHEWIPCSEWLPEYRKNVDVTTRDLRVNLAYLDSIEEDGTDDLWVMPLEDAECALWNVVAWKPRPEPWKGERDD